ncbi:MAG: hypothetical protein Q8S14_09100, partial [Algoriphagus sp.]|uniref:hypothetical protein n=1 Tax=Algoriphagus sp. TaxID=1872435 RepID=UPI0027325B89
GFESSRFSGQAVHSAYSLSVIWGFFVFAGLGFESSRFSGQAVHSAYSLSVIWGFFVFGRSWF